MFAHIMLGDRSKAKSMAHKIWEIGGSLAPFFEHARASCKFVLPKEIYAFFLWIGEKISLRLGDAKFYKL